MMKQILLTVDGEADIRFTGELVAEAKNSDDRGSGANFSGSTGRWSELKLYKTKAGKFICHRIDRTRWQGETDAYSAKVCEQASDIVEFFGFSAVAKDLYYEAGLTFVTDVD